MSESIHITKNSNTTNKFNRIIQKTKAFLKELLKLSLGITAVVIISYILTIVTFNVVDRWFYSRVHEGLAFGIAVFFICLTIFHLNNKFLFQKHVITSIILYLVISTSTYIISPLNRFTEVLFVMLAVGGPILLSYCVFLKRKSLEKTKIECTQTQLVSEEALILKVNQFFDSQQFLTVLRTALPDGKDSKEYGFDYIPFMLDAIEARRQRFEKSSLNFLRMTIALGLIFSSLLTLLAYLLINEAAAGTQRTLVNLETNTRELENNLQGFTNYATEKFIANNIDPIFQNYEESEAKKQLYNFYQSDSKYDLKKLLELLRTNNNQMSLKGFSKSSIKIYQHAVKETEVYVEGQENVYSQLPSQINALKANNTLANEFLGRPENRIPEIIKRLFLSIALATFFIAILRYAAKLYRNHYQQLILAEQESLAIRKFYVGYKASKDEEQRKVVLAAFMGGNVAPLLNDEKDTIQGAETNPEILKEVISAFLKKL